MFKQKGKKQMLTNNEIVEALKAHYYYREVKFKVDGDGSFRFRRKEMCFDGHYFDRDCIPVDFRVQRDEEDNVLIVADVNYYFEYDYNTLVFLDRQIRAIQPDEYLGEYVQFNPVLRLSSDAHEFYGEDGEFGPDVDGYLELSYKVFAEHIDDGDYYVTVINKLVEAGMYLVDFIAEYIEDNAEELEE